MADNITLNVGTSGSVLRTDDDGTAHHQYVKVEWGADNTQTPVAAGTSALPVQGAAAENAAAAGSPVLAAGRYDATPRTLGDGDAGALALDADGALHVADGGNSLTVDNGGTFAVQVDGSALTALQLIDDAVHADDAAFTLGTSKGVAIMGFAGTQSVDANDAAVLACDTDGALHVSDGGNSLTVDGTVTANLSATDNAVLDTIAANTNNLNNCIIQDDAPFTPAIGYLMMIGGEFDDVGTDSVDEGDAGNVRISANRSMYVQLRDAAGNERGLNVDASGHIGVTNGGTFAVQVDAALPAGTNAIGKLAANSGVDIGDVDVLSIAAGSNLVGDVGLSGARTSGGTTLHTNNGTSTLTQVKGAAGQIYWLHVINLKASVLYLQVFNKASASVTLGTTTPDMVFPLPTQGDTNGAGFTLSVPNGIAMGTGISYAVTTTKGGSTTASADEAFVNLGYA